MKNNFVLAIGCFIILLAILSAYVSGFNNPISMMVPPWKKESCCNQEDYRTIPFNCKCPYFSLSSALHFGNKWIVIPLMIIGASVVIITILKNNGVNYKSVANSVVVLTAFVLMIILMFYRFVYGCDCTMTNLPPCCHGLSSPGPCPAPTKIPVREPSFLCNNNKNDHHNFPLLSPIKLVGINKQNVGSCNKDNLNSTFQNMNNLEGKCCNPPACTDKQDKFMGKQHILISHIITALIAILMIININIKPLRYILLILIGISVFLYLTEPGDKMRILFGSAEFSVIPLFLISIYFAGRQKCN